MDLLGQFPFGNRKEIIINVAVHSMVQLNINCLVFERITVYALIRIRIELFRANMIYKTSRTISNETFECIYFFNLFSKDNVKVENFCMF